jgi:hypothetical protein
MLHRLAELLFLLPWCLLLAGALRRVLAKPDRLQRMQCEGAVIVVAGMLGALLLFDPVFGLEAARRRFGEWYPWGERGLFWIGMLLFGLGWFLERRPRPGLKRWSPAGKAAALAGILAGGTTALALHGHTHLLGCLFPWSPFRIALSLGMAPFAVLYCADAFRNGPQSGDAETIY